MMTAAVAFVIDCLIGDPRSRLHPVVLIGKWIARLEKWLYRPEASDQGKFLAGFCLVVIVLASSYGAAAGLLYLAGLSENPYIVGFASALLLSFAIAPRNLAEAGWEIRRYLLAGDLSKARFKVGWIVGRDTDRLTAGEVTRATVETIAENIVDGVISPLFFFYLGGVPLAMAYRAANTMDSMLGYKNDRYLYFGRAAARMDDAWNYLPARITGILLVAAAWLLRLDFRAAWRMMRRDARKHPSPNGGYTEATVAGALGVRLGGFNSYFGQPSFRTYMGDDIRSLAPEHIDQVIRLLYVVTILFLCLATALCRYLDGGTA